MTISFALELTLTGLLATTLVYCVLLERRLAAVRKGQEGLKTMIGELDAAISGAGASLRALKAAASSAADTLDERLKRARALADELALLSSSGERIAERFDRTTTTRSGPRASQLPSGSVMHRLDALKAVR
jgi:ABC-type transporter Mla subunit MlaD